MDEPKKYREIAGDLERKIKAGELLPGARLPSDAELGEMYTASRNTVREAVRLLVSRGLAEKRSGRGAFVLLKIAPFSTVISVGSGFGGFQGAIHPSDGVSGGRAFEVTVPKFEVTVPKVEIQQPTADIAAQLGLPEGSTVVIRHQERSIDGVLWSTQTSYYPMQFVLAGAARLLEVGDITEGVRKYLDQTLGVKEIGSHDTMKVRAPSRDEAAPFGIPDDGRIAVFETRQIGVDPDHKPVRVTISIYPADRNQFSMDTGSLADTAG
jgi:GntR family transcriptional regulator